MAKPEPPVASPSSSFSGCLLRAFWMLVGNVVLAFCAIAVARHRDRLLSVADLAFWVTAAALLLARYIDIKRCKGMTGSGEEATSRHWRRYACILVICAAALWVAAHVGARAGIL